MNKIIPLAALLLPALILTGLVRDSAPASAALSMEIPAIAELRAEVDRLTQRVQILEEKAASTRLAIPAESLPGASPIPDHWQRYDFQGQTFYLVPLDLPR